jgi:hypothetical protein
MERTLNDWIREAEEDAAETELIDCPCFGRGIKFDECIQGIKERRCNLECSNVATD